MIQHVTPLIGWSMKYGLSKLCKSSDKETVWSAQSCAAVLMLTDKDKDLMMWVSQQHRNADCLWIGGNCFWLLCNAWWMKPYEENHDEEWSEITATLHPPHWNESVVLASDDVSQVAFVVFLFSENLHACHQQIVIAKELLENEATEGIAKAFVSLWIQRDDFYRNVETLSCRSR